MTKYNVNIRSGGELKHFKTYTRGMAIKQFCRDCMNGSADEVRNCSAPECPLFCFRPFQKPRKAKPPAIIEAGSQLHGGEVQKQYT
jgi:hypothetical protein